MPLSDRATSTRRPTRTRVLASGVLVVAACLGLLVLRHASGGPDGPRPVVDTSSVIQGPQPSPATVRLPTGRALRCPQGAEPAVTLFEVAFTPPLVGGTSFRAGTHTVVATGWVVNETDHPIRVRRVVPTVLRHRWDARTEVAPAVSAEARVPLTIRGTVHQTRRTRALLETHLHWQWQESRYRACGSKGLTEDD